MSVRITNDVGEGEAEQGEEAILASLSEKDRKLLQAVEKKVAEHPVKRLASFLKPFALGTSAGLKRKYLGPERFVDPADAGKYAVDLALVVVHSGISRWMPDLALKGAEGTAGGRVHAAIRLGPLLLDWNDSNLVGIRRYESCKSLVLLEASAPQQLYSGADAKAVEALMQPLVALVLQWNTGKTLDKNKSSSLAFAEQCCGTLKSSVAYPKGVRALLADLSKKGDKVSLSFSGLGEKKKVKFRTHEELDEWLVRKRSEMPDVETTHPEEWMLLRLMDRQFWAGLDTADKSKWAAPCGPRANACALGTPPCVTLLPGAGIGGARKNKNAIVKKQLK